MKMPVLIQVQVSVFRIVAVMGAVISLLAVSNGVGSEAEKIFQFEGGSPLTGLVQASDGNFYGTTSASLGATGVGTLVRVTPGGQVTTLYTFSGENPIGSLIQASDGYLYGRTDRGGSFGLGSIFKATFDGRVTILADFNDDSGYAFPDEPSVLVEGSDGNFYGTNSEGGTSSSGESGFGTVFRMTPDGTLTTLVVFTAQTIGGNPQGGLVQGTDGNFYGTTSDSIFRMTPAGELTTIATFTAANGGEAFGALIQGRDGSFYGTTEGTVFKVTPDGTLTTLVTFTGTNGEAAECSLTQGPDGSLYGTTTTGGASYQNPQSPGFGTVFKVAPDGTFATLVSFDGKNGANPVGGVVIGADGNLYGATDPNAIPTVFKVSLSGTLTTLASLAPSNGAIPGAGLVRGADGNFYGTTTIGGSSFRSVSNPGLGVAFRITPAGAYTVLANLTNHSGTDCLAPLFQASDSNFYGTAYSGGNDNGLGTVFKISPLGALTTVVTFGYPGNPAGALMQASDGNLYGTENGGQGGTSGSVFRLTPQGAFTPLASFNFDKTSVSPSCALVEGPDGSLYGTTTGGQDDYGSVFKVSLAGVLTPLFFFNDADGSDPEAGLTLGPDGNLYGTTCSGGGAEAGTIFQVTPAGVLTTLVNFTGPNGAYPCAALVLGGDGNFYGTCSQGGDSFQSFEVNPGDGTVFRMTPQGQLTTLYSFNDASPVGGVVFGGKKLYGATSTYLYALPSEPSAPSVSVGRASGITATSATVSGNIAPGQLDTTYLVQYGVTNVYGSTTAAQRVGPTYAPVAVSRALTGLAGHTLYHYTITATNSNGTISGEDATFFTADAPPAAPDINLQAGVAAGAAVSVDVLATAMDPDGDALSISKVGKPAHGSVSIVGGKILYIGSPGFRGTDAFTYEISDGFGGVSTGSVVLHIQPDTAPVPLIVGVDDPSAGSVDLPPSSLRQLNSSSAVTALPHRGYAFTGWTGSDANGPIASSTSNPLVFTVTQGLHLTANFTAVPVNATIVAATGQAAPGLNGATFSAFGIPETGSFAGAYVKDARTVAAIFGKDGSVLLSSGEQMPGLPGAFIAKLGQPSGDAALVTLVVGQGGITSRDDVVLVTGLSTGTPTIAAQTGVTNLNVVGANAVTIENFLSIDGSGSSIFFLATLNGSGSTSPNNVAFCSISSGSAFLLTDVRSIDGFGTTGLRTLVGSVGTLADGRWRADDSDVGAAIQDSGAIQFIYSVSASASFDWNLLFQTGAQAISGISSMNGQGLPTIASFEIPAFGPSGCAVLAKLVTGGASGTSTANNVALLIGNGQNAPLALARKGDFVSIDAGGYPLNDLRVSLLQDPIVGAGGKVAFLFTASEPTNGLGSTASVSAIGYSADGMTWKTLANVGGVAPGGGMWSSFSSLVLPKGGAGAPVFTGTLAVNPAAGLTNENRLGLWGVTSNGTLQLLFCDGDVLNVAGSNKAVRSFTALTPAPGANGSAAGYDDNGNIAIAATFTDGSQALLRLAVP